MGNISSNVTYVTNKIDITPIMEELSIIKDRIDNMPHQCSSVIFTDKIVMQIDLNKQLIEGFQKAIDKAKEQGATQIEFYKNSVIFSRDN